jgi:amino acid adenylation domain-containing protein
MLIKQFIHELVENQVERFPDDLAIVCENQHLTFRELNEKSNQLANFLVSKGVGPDTLIAVCIERSPQLIMAILAVLKSGGAYVAMDPAYPPERLRYILHDAQASFVITNNHLANIFTTTPQSHAKTILSIDQDEHLWKSFSMDNPHIQLSPDNLAYVIYTSGSTGNPKGTLIPHAGLQNLVEWYGKTFHLTRDDHFSQFSSPGFDAMICEVWPSLSFGATLYLVPSSVRYSPDELQSWMIENNITVCDLPALLVQKLVSLKWNKSKLRILKSGGEKLTLYPDQTKYSFAIWNTYGPTEATVENLFYCLQKGLTKRSLTPPIGKPIENISIHLIDNQLNEVPAGEEGELCISGISLARGYLHQPELTASQFIPNPFSHKPGERMYKTGDLCRYLSDGNIEYIGRIDHQVKIRGFRVELGEIEACLRKYSHIKDAVVVMQEEDNQKKLVAYLTMEKNNKTPFDAMQLKEYLKQRLPDYMIPIAYVVLQSFPLTTHGKLDRRNLPLPQQGDYPHTSYRAPETIVQKQFVKIF